MQIFTVTGQAIPLIFLQGVVLNFNELKKLTSDKDKTYSSISFLAIEIQTPFYLDRYSSVFLHYKNTKIYCQSGKQGVFCKTLYLPLSLIFYLRLN